MGLTFEGGLVADRSDGKPGPTLAVVVVAFNRAEYLKGLIGSLLSQEDARPYEFVLLDNGSDLPLEMEVLPLLEQINGSVVVIREERNVLSPFRWQQAVEASTADFILLPGDDDVARPGYLREMQELAASGSDVTLISAASGQVDSQGRRLPTTVVPAQFDNQPTALAALLSANCYWMPASGFRRSAIDLSSVPQTRTAFDWWLWIQCWLAGVAATSDREVVLYRQHGGQEQRHYGSQSFRLDAGRMLASVVMGPRFENVLSHWTRAEAEMFAQGILDRAGPNSGDSRWGPLVQVLLADRLRGRVEDDVVAALHAQAAAQAGAPAAVGVLRALTGDPSIVKLPPVTWSRVPIGATWSGVCPLLDRWEHYLQLPSRPGSAIVVAFACSCSGRPSDRHLVTVRGGRADGNQSFVLDLAGEPNEGSAAQLLDSIGIHTGRLHGFEASNGVEARVVNVVRTVRQSRLGSSLEDAYKRRPWARRVHRGGL